jgi:hypothetical protein
MERDIVIAGLMVLTSVATLLAIVWTVARAVREEPEYVLVVDRPTPRPTQGW